MCTAKRARSASHRCAQLSLNSSHLDAMLHLLARYLEMRPLFLCLALPMKEEWKMRPYLGVFPLVFRALNRAFSAPKICTVDAGYLARFVKEPATQAAVMRHLTAGNKPPTMPSRKRIPWDWQPCCCRLAMPPCAMHVVTG